MNNRRILSLDSEIKAVLVVKATNRNVPTGLIFNAEGRKAKKPNRYDDYLIPAIPSAQISIIYCDGAITPSEIEITAPEEQLDGAQAIVEAAFNFKFSNDEITLK
jgi:hypothetical protein